MTTPADINISGWTVQSTSPYYDGSYTASERPVDVGTLFVDGTLSADITNGTYSIANRDNSGSDGNAYITVADAIANCVVGDVIQMRDGTYSEIAIDIPESKNGTAWTDGNFTTLMSYPGEWAKIDGTGLNTGLDWWDQSVIMHPLGYGNGSDTWFTEYWHFKNFEVTGGFHGIALKPRYTRFHHLYVHDNGREGGDVIVGGIYLINPQHCEIKYSWITDNEKPLTPTLNNSNIIFNSDYNDLDGDGNAWVQNASTHHNEVAYNFLSGSQLSLRHKNQQRFGLNNRNPNDMTYADYGDNWHHNIILGATESIGSGQDFTQIHHNICDATINIGRVGGTYSDVPIVYNECVYNNLCKRDASLGTYGSLATSGGWDVAMSNYYDTGSPVPNATKVIHEHRWILNNILGENPNGDTVMRFHQNTPNNNAVPTQDNADLVVDYNFIHNNGDADDPVWVGNNDDAAFTGCDNQLKTVSEFNTCSATWRSVGTVYNWENSTSGLYTGGTGANQYTPVASFVVDTGITVSDGGIGGNHPYLAATTLPSYIGPANPADYAWISGVYDNVPSVAWLKIQTTDPSWIE